MSARRPRRGDRVALEMRGFVVELLDRDGVAGAVVDLDVDGHDRVRTWVPLGALHLVFATAGRAPVLGPITGGA